MRTFVALAVVIALFSGCSESYTGPSYRLGPDDIERYGYGIFRVLCNYDIHKTNNLALDIKDLQEGPNTKLLQLEKELRTQNPGLNRYPSMDDEGKRTDGLFDATKEGIATGMTPDHFIKLYEKLFLLDENNDGRITVDEFIKSLINVFKPDDKNKSTKNPGVAWLLARFIAAVADDTCDGHMDASEFTVAVLGDGGLPYTANVVMFRFMDFRKDTASTEAGVAGGKFQDNHTLIHTSVLVDWLLSGNSFHEGVKTALFMPIAA